MRVVPLRGLGFATYKKKGNEKKKNVTLEYVLIGMKVLLKHCRRRMLPNASLTLLVLSARDYYVPKLIKNVFTFLSSSKVGQPQVAPFDIVWPK